MSTNESKPTAEQPTTEQTEELAPESVENSNESVAAEQSDADEALSERVAELELALEKAERGHADANERAVRAVAEMENVRRRASADVEKAHKFALEKFAQDLLTTLDNFERALAVAEQSESVDKAFVEGIELTYKGLLSTMQRFDVQPVGAEGEVFNPELHQAMSMQAAPDRENNTILAVLQKGYTLNGRLLRPAMVMIVKN
ncbi:nucleotide exchange factor GrpE [Pseudidiomarina aestuarii]|uniref:Protein GrpE n=1 Tax=Pseudidiomarina aestuarii TaxID=624146 RepID=A0A7Z6ZUF1_9GAMM|nr:nucleotide exchange factor GrpE [Pseudidiomarina aestuarii]RUO41431.1 nucleotide exchange factor GrpE [Pseudidiomarina aestuarii]